MRSGILTQFIVKSLRSRIQAMINQVIYYIIQVSLDCQVILYIILYKYHLIVKYNTRKFYIIGL